MAVDELSSQRGREREFLLYCSLSDLHGWQYFTLRGKDAAFKCMWAAVIFSSAVTSAVILAYAFLEYVEDAVQTTYDPSL